MIPGYFPQTNPRQGNSTELHGVKYARSIPPRNKSLTKELSTCSSITCDLPDIDTIIIQKLRKRSYHLPGNNFYQDLCMYMKNNNLVFGLCCHHPLHPVTLRHRLVILMGSLAFGLSATNVVYLYYLYGRMDDVKSSDVAISFTLGLGGSGEGGGEEEGATITSNYQWVNNTLTIDISHGMAMLWTVGAAAHSMFDYVVWHMVACAYTNRKCCQYFGWSLAVSIVMLLVALTSFLTLLRATSSTGEESDATTLTMPGLDDIQHAVGGLWNCEDSPWYFSSEESKCTNDRLHTESEVLFDNMQFCCEDHFGGSASCAYKDACIDESTSSSYTSTEDEIEVSDFRYMYGCLLELAISLFIYTPMMQLILFSGILGCGILPVFGGRFYTMRNEHRENHADK